MTYPIACSSEAAQAFQVAAFPTAFVIAPDGKTVLWQGHPAMCEVCITPTELALGVVSCSACLDHEIDPGLRLQCSLYPATNRLVRHPGRCQEQLKLLAEHISRD